MKAVVKILFRKHVLCHMHASVGLFAIYASEQSALAVVYDSRSDNDGSQSCEFYFNVINIREVAKQVMDAFKFPAAEQNQDLFCTGFKPYPRGLGPNANLWLKYDTTTSNCQLTN
jgi:hypothetical protein